MGTTKRPVPFRNKDCLVLLPKDFYPISPLHEYWLVEVQMFAYPQVLVLVQCRCLHAWYGQFSNRLDQAGYLLKNLLNLKKIFVNSKEETLFQNINIIENFSIKRIIIGELTQMIYQRSCTLREQQDLLKEWSFDMEMIGYVNLEY